MDDKILCQHFEDYYFDTKEDRNIDRNFIEAVIADDEFLYKLFIEGKSRKQISEELNVDMSLLCTHILSKKSKINKLYDMYSRTGYRKDLIEEVLKYRFKSKYVDDMVSLYNRDIKEPMKYIRFTEHYFPEILGKLSNASEKYFRFIDEVISRKRILRDYFEKNKRAKDISLELGKSEVYVTNELYELKSKIRLWYSKYQRSSLNNRGK